MANRDINELPAGYMSTSTLKLSSVEIITAYDMVQFAIRGLRRGGCSTPTCPDPSIKIPNLAISTVPPGSSVPGISTRAISNNLCQTTGNWYWFDRFEFADLIEEEATKFPVVSYFTPQKIMQFKSVRCCSDSYFYRYGVLDTIGVNPIRTRWNEDGSVDDTVPYSSPVAPAQVSFLEQFIEQNTRVEADRSSGTISQTTPESLITSGFSPNSYVAWWDSPGWSRVSCADLAPFGAKDGNPNLPISNFVLVSTTEEIQPQGKVVSFDTDNSLPTPGSVVHDLKDLTSALREQRFVAYYTPIPSAWEINTEDPSNR